MSAPLNVCIVGSGNWGSAIAKIIGQNTAAKSTQFNERVNMYMHQEMVDGQKLTDIFNSEHENVKYLPGIKIPENVVAVPNLLDAARESDILIFVIPHQFVRRICAKLAGNIKKTTIAVSMIKGFELGEGEIHLISHSISKLLNIPCSVLMGANLAPEVAQEQFCETTIGCHSAETGQLLKDLFVTPYFRCVVVEDSDTVEMCGALKNIVGIGAGIVDGLNYGDNTKAAVIRLGLMEMIKFGKIYFPGCKVSTFFESCGIADLVATCHGGRNRMLGEAVVKESSKDLHKTKSVLELEEEILHGQSFQGPLVAREINAMLVKTGKEDEFPLFTAINKICDKTLDAHEFIECLRNHPEHM